MKTPIRLLKIYQSYKFKLSKTRTYELLSGLLSAGTVKKLFWAFALYLFFIALESVYFKPHNIDWFFERVFIEYGFEEPELMSRLKFFNRFGIKFFDGKVKNISESNKTEQYKELIIRNMDLLTSYRRTDLTKQQRLSADILHKYLENEILRFSVYKEEYLANHVSGLHISFPEFMIEVHEINNLWDAESYILRLSSFAKNMDNLREIMDLRENETGIMPPKIALQKVREQLNTFVNSPVEFNILYLDFQSKLSKCRNISEMGERELLYEARGIIEDEIKPSYMRLYEYLERLEQRTHEESSIYHQPNGADYYSYMMKIYSGSDSTIDEIHQIGLAETERLKAETNAILQFLQKNDPKKSMAENLRFLDEKEHFFSTDSLAFAECYNEIKNIIGETFLFLPQIFPVKNLPKHFKLTPPNINFLERNALLTYIKTENDTVFFSVNAENIHLTARHELRGIVYEECAGTFLQKFLEEQIPNMPTFRKTLEFVGFDEAWRLYAARLCFEKSYFKNEIELLSYLRRELLSSGMIVADTGIHAKKWTREQTITYLHELTGYPKIFLAEKTDACIVLPAKSVMPKIGHVRMRDLKNYAAKKIGKNFNGNDFNFFIVKNGQMHLTVLNKLVFEYIKDKKNGQ
jgi:uncharacterized protein (DUF885 family)